MKHLKLILLVVPLFCIYCAHINDKFEGKWEVQIEDLNDRDNKVKSSIEFHNDGSCESVSHGNLSSEGISANYLIVEKCTWKIDDGFLLITSIESRLKDLEGDQEFINQIQFLYAKYFKPNSKQRYKIRKVDENEFVLLVDYGDGTTRKGYYKRIN